MIIQFQLLDTYRHRDSFKNINLSALVEFGHKTNIKHIFLIKSK